MTFGGAKLTGLGIPQSGTNQRAPLVEITSVASAMAQASVGFPYMNAFGAARAGSEVSRAAARLAGDMKPWATMGPRDVPEVLGRSKMDFMASATFVSRVDDNGSTIEVKKPTDLEREVLSTPLYMRILTILSTAATELDLNGILKKIEPSSGSSSSASVARALKTLSNNGFIQVNSRRVNRAPRPRHFYHIHPNGRYLVDLMAIATDQKTVSSSPSIPDTDALRDCLPIDRFLTELLTAGGWVKDSSFDDQIVAAALINNWISLSADGTYYLLNLGRVRLIDLYLRLQTQALRDAATLNDLLLRLQDKTT